MSAQLTIHPDALDYPLMPDDELASLAEDIAANGQRDPIILDQDDRLIDGRNRLEACRRAEVEPVFATVEFADDDEIAAYILSVNVEKRSLTNGQKAMFRACAMANKRKGGRWERGSVLGNGDITESRNTYKDAMNKAGLVLDVAARASSLGPEFQPYVEQPAQVKAGCLTLHAAYRIAQDYESKAAMAEMAVWMPFTKAAGQLEQLSIEAEQSTELPAVDAPLSKTHRNQLEDTAKRFSAIAAAIRTYLKENK